MGDPILVFSTAPTRESARDIAKRLVEEKLAACVQVVPGLISFYIWQGQLCDEPEFLLLIKSRADLFDRVAQRIRSLHDYTVPEIVSLRIAEGSKEYLAWMEASLVKPVKAEG